MTTRVALVGNPNCGKTTLFNALTGSNQMVGNWPGVTVERKEGDCTFDGETLRIIDLPGIYSLVAHSEDERVSRDYLLSGDADLILNVVDATNLERNLYLTQLLRELGFRVVVALNMWDLAEQRGLRLDLPILEERLGIRIVPTTATHSSAIHMLKQELVGEKRNPRPVQSLETILEFALLQEALTALGGPRRGMVSLESHETPEAIAWSERLETALGDPVQILLAEARYRLIGEALEAAQSVRVQAAHQSERLDRILLNRVAGLPLFFVAMYCVFWITIHFGGAFIDFFDQSMGAIFVDGLGRLLTSLHAPAWLNLILTQGVGSGLQTLSTFIPLIFVLFLMLSILEDSGYMARAAFLMDRFMRLVGLPGKAFVPLLVGFGCTVPAILATRTLEHRRDRVMTILMAPFMSCGAKMPVYALFAVAFFPHAGQNAVFLLYLTGIAVAVGTGLLLKGSLFRGEASRFVLELPPYHLPSPYGVLRHSWYRLKDFILKAGKILILVMTVLGTLNAIDTHGKMGVGPGEYSLLAKGGMVVAPLFKPLGVTEDNWPASVALFMGIFAKEIVVGTMNSLYLQQATLSNDAPKITSAPILAQLYGAVATTGGNLRDLFLNHSRESSAEHNPVFGPLRKNFAEGALQAFAFLLFVLLYVPCVSATTTAARELGGGLTLFMIAYTTGLAWSLSTLFYQITLGHDTFWILIALGILVAGFTAVKMQGQKT